MVESISSCTLVASSSLMSCPLLGGLVYTRFPATVYSRTVPSSEISSEPSAALALPAVTPIVLLALLLWPVAAVAQSPSWEDRLGVAERAWDRGQTAEAERQYLEAVKQAESFGPADPRLAQSLTALGLFYREQGRIPEASPVLH